MRVVVMFLLLTFITMSCVSVDTKSNVAKRPNIIFILSDDLSFRDVSFNGQKNFKTPSIDRLALNGLRFTQAYSGSPECAPSRASLMTGLHMGHCRVRRNKSLRGHPSTEENLAESNSYFLHLHVQKSK